MRAAVLSTIAVLVCLVVYAEYRRERFATPPNAASPESPARGSAPLPDVAAAAPRPDASAPAPAVEGSADPADATYETAARSVDAGARRHVVRDGDDLASIAQHYYGDPARAQEIYEANRDRIRDPEKLHAGQELTIP